MRAPLYFPFARFKTFGFQANGFSIFLILNIEYRTKTFEQQKFYKKQDNIVHFDILRSCSSK